MIDDVVLTFSVAMGAAFIVLGAFLLAKFRALANESTASSDVGKNLWHALDARLKKQDERILDLIARTEVLQSRISQKPTLLEAVPLKRTGAEPEVTSIVEPQIPRERRTAASRSPEPTEKVVLQLLSEKPRTSMEIKVLINKSREHTARLMKYLFERGMVVRNDSKKPFVYRLTEQGRRYFSET